MDLTARTDLGDLELTEIEHAVSSLGAERYHARQIFGWIYRRGVTGFEAMTDLSRPLRTRLAESATVATPETVRRDVSHDGTTKYLLQLADSRQVESVFIPDTPAQTLCISTQVGCAMGCGFCLTGQMGMVRNLTPARSPARSGCSPRIRVSSLSPSTSS
jgi:23S rRNA (adenine2503-C2)-methyltransferase